jgi:uncharacterized protein (TIGR03118 family)
LRLVAAAVSLVAAASLASAARLPAQPDGFVVHRLVSDRGDPRLVNAWGLAAKPSGAWWVANEGRSSSTVYMANGRRLDLTVDVPGGPTGVVFNRGRGFLVGRGANAAPARFLYACEDGMVRAWAPTVPVDWSTEAVVAVDATASAAVFRGLALAAGRLYATDFHNARVRVFDARWRPVLRRGAFVDHSIPHGYAPFGIQALGGRIFVTYAWRAPVNGNDAPSGGYVDEFDLDGRLLARVGRSEELDEPWGLALAPRGLGRFGGDVLVANFGSGRINAYARRGRDWALRGRLPVKIPGVWGIAFGTGGSNGPRTTLFYAAGPHRWHGASEVDVHGVFGSITPA